MCHKYFVDDFRSSQISYILSINEPSHLNSIAPLVGALHLTSSTLHFIATNHVPQLRHRISVAPK